MRNAIGARRIGLPDKAEWFTQVSTYVEVGLNALDELRKLTSPITD